MITAARVGISSMEPFHGVALRPAGNSALQTTESIHGPGMPSSWAYSRRNPIARQVGASADGADGNGAADARSISAHNGNNNSWSLKNSRAFTDVRQQPALRVAYQGIPGAYSEEAAMLTHPGCRPLPCLMYETAVRSVEFRRADRAILPVESTLEGSRHRNYDLLLQKFARLHIVGEIHLPISYCLLAAPGVTKENLRRVISHPLAISQCQRTLTDLGLAAVARQTVDDTAAAAHFISCNSLRDAAAIASARAAEIYGLRVLARGIQDDSCSVTRFVVLAREPVPFPACGDRPCKTSIVIACDGELDALFKVLSAFSFRNINLTKLESRPKMNNPLRVVEGGGGSGPLVRQFQYVFYIDFEASMADRRAQHALAKLKEFTTFLRVLGSYPADIDIRP